MLFGPANGATGDGEAVALPDCCAIPGFLNADVDGASRIGVPTEGAYLWGGVTRGDAGWSITIASSDGAMDDCELPNSNGKPPRTDCPRMRSACVGSYLRFNDLGSGPTKRLTRTAHFAPTIQLPLTTSPFLRSARIASAGRK